MSNDAKATKKQTAYLTYLGVPVEVSRHWSIKYASQFISELTSPDRATQEQIEALAGYGMPKWLAAHYTQAGAGALLAVREQVTQVWDQLGSVRDQARSLLPHVQDRKAQALLETTAAVLQGLMKAFEDDVQGTEDAWR